MTGFKQFGLKLATVVALFGAFTFMAPEAQAGGFGITLHGGGPYGGYSVGYYDRGYGGGGYYGAGYGYGGGGGYYGAGYGYGGGGGYYGGGYGYYGRPHYRPIYRQAYNYYPPVRHRYRAPWCGYHRAYHVHSRGYGYSDPYDRDSGYRYSDRNYNNDRYYDDGYRR